MNSHSWKHIKQLQDMTRNGYNNLVTKRRDTDNSFLEEFVIDFILIGIGLSIYIQLDIRQFLPFSLPDVIQNGSLRLIVAVIGLALAGSGGVRLLAASIEAATWMVSRVLKGNKDDV
jgi:hypothetical protein